MTTPTGVSAELLALADRLSGGLGPFHFVTKEERDLVVSALRASAQNASVPEVDSECCVPLTGTKATGVGEAFEFKEFREDAFRSMEVQICGKTNTVQFSCADHGGDHPTEPSVAIKWVDAARLCEWVLSRVCNEAAVAWIEQTEDDIASTIFLALVDKDIVKMSDCRDIAKAIFALSGTHGENDSVKTAEG